MNCEELKSRLDAAACSTANYSIGTRENDTFCLEQFDGDWWVFYTERGIVNDPEFRSASEAEACAYLFPARGAGWLLDILSSLPAIREPRHVPHCKPVLQQRRFPCSQDRLNLVLWA